MRDILDQESAEKLRPVMYHVLFRILHGLRECLILFLMDFSYILGVSTKDDIYGLYFTKTIFMLVVICGVGCANS